LRAPETVQEAVRKNRYLSEIKRREHYENPASKERKVLAAKKRALKKLKRIAEKALLEGMAHKEIRMTSAALQGKDATRVSVSGCS